MHIHDIFLPYEYPRAWVVEHRYGWTERPMLEIRRGLPVDADRVAITGAFAGVAETGTLIFTSGPDHPPSLNLLPETHVVILREDDLVGAYRLAIRDPGIAGPLLGAAPEPCRQRDLVATLARVLRRPNWLPIPGWVLRLLLREEATLLLGSRRVVPGKLLAAGYTFRYADLEAALREALGRPATS